MEFVLYVLETDSTIRISIAFHVDTYFWGQQGISTQWVTSTRSMGQAMKLAQTGSERTVYNEWKRLKNEEWQYIEECARGVYPFLEGRSLLWPEVISVLHRNGEEYTEVQLAEFIQYLKLHQRVNYLEGVILEGAVSKRYCNRCLATSSSIYVAECATCEEYCAMCEKCLLLGRSRSCSLLLQFNKEDRTQLTPIRPPEIALTSAQTKISEQVNMFLGSSEQRALVWAVTGAGKTEMLVPCVWKFLSEGRRVVWVTPRKDVVIEIAPRMQEFFPDVSCVALYGGSGDAWKGGRLVIATAHQALRFYHFFDFVIVDEVDAFPLYGEESLEKGIERALTENGKHIYLTATPPVKWRSYMEKRSTLFVLPVRYHGRPLPVPQLKREWFLTKKLMRRLPIPTVHSFLTTVKEKAGQAFLFVPRTRDVQNVVDWLVHQGGIEKKRVAGVYSHDPLRKEKVQRFRNGSIQFLVTTTILERGVTVPRCFVLVWGADHPVFDQASLVQIAGRVGRSKEYQEGEVWFLGKERSESQRKAKKEINELNEQAKKEGYLKKGAYIP